MPRIPRGQVPGYVFHAINRGNDRKRVFHKPQDYRSFVDLMSEARKEFPVRILAFCLMPNHFHFVLEPDSNVSISSFMQWLLTSHVRRYHSHHGSSGHVWQGRFKSFPIQGDNHLLTVIRYVLLNPVRAGLASECRQWPWSSFSHPSLISPWPVACPADWDLFLDEPIHAEEIDAIRRSVNRNAPYGTLTWQLETARTLGLESTLRPRGRPKKEEEK